MTDTKKLELLERIVRELAVVIDSGSSCRKSSGLLRELIAELDLDAAEGQR